MARLAQAEKSRNYTSVASPNEQTHGKLHVESPDKADAPSCLILNSVSDAGVVTPRFLWVDSTGDLRIKADTPPTNQDADGTVVGTQS